MKRCGTAALLALVVAPTGDVRADRIRAQDPARFPDGYVAASPATDTLPERFGAWRFLLGEWNIVTRRHSFDGDVIERETGSTRFWVAPGGQQMLELEHTVLNGLSIDALQVFAVDPRDGTVEIARTDSGHYKIGILRGVMTHGRMELTEKHVDDGAEVIRRMVYVGEGADRFTRRLDFSTDGGETWFVRFEASYTRSGPA